jgi:hypothetical protein
MLGVWTNTVDCCSPVAFNRQKCHTVPVIGVRLHEAHGSAQSCVQHSVGYSGVECRSDVFHGVPSALAHADSGPQPEGMMGIGQIG